MVGEFCALIRGKHADVQDSYTTRMVLVNAKNQLHACRVLKMAVKTTRRTAAVSQRAWMKQRDRRRRIPWVSLTFHGRHFSFDIIRTVRWLESQWVACVSYHRRTTPLQFVFVRIVDTEIAVKIISKLFNIYLCTTQLNLTHFWGKRLDPCCPLDHNNNQFKRNFAKLWQGNKQATTEDRRGEVRFRLYAIYRTLGVSTAGSNLAHRSGVTKGIGIYPSWAWQKPTGEIPPDGYF